MLQVDLRTLFSFSMTGMADFLVKKQRPPRNLASAYLSDVIQFFPRVFQWPQEGMETRRQSDSGWSSIVISRYCHYTLRHTYARMDPSPWSIASPALCNFQKNLLLSGWSVAYREGHSTNQLDDSLACGLSGNTRRFPINHSPLSSN